MDARLEKGGYKSKWHVIVPKDHHVEEVADMVEEEVEVVMGEVMEVEDIMIVRQEEETIVQDEEIAEVHQEEEEAHLLEDVIAEALQEDVTAKVRHQEDEMIAEVLVQKEKTEARAVRHEETIVEVL